MTRNGGLLYADYRNRSINHMSGTQRQTRLTLLRKKSNPKIQTLITLQGWIPWGLCITSSEDLLVIITSDDENNDDDDDSDRDSDESDDGKQTKVVRYAGSIEKQWSRMTKVTRSFHLVVTSVRTRT